MGRRAVVCGVVALVAVTAPAGALTAEGPRPADLLLGIERMPDGWVPYTPRSPGGTGLCGFLLSRAVPRYATGRYHRAPSGRPRAFQEAIGLHPGDDGARRVFGRWRRVVRTCRPTMIAGVSVHIRPVAVPRIGDEALGLRLELLAPGNRTSSVDILSRRGRALVATRFQTVGNPDVPAAVRFARLQGRHAAAVLARD